MSPRPARNRASRRDGAPWPDCPPPRPGPIMGSAHQLPQSRNVRPTSSSSGRFLKGKLPKVSAMFNAGVAAGRNRWWSRAVVRQAERDAEEWAALELNEYASFDAVELAGLIRSRKVSAA